MCKINDGVILEYLGQNKVILGENKYPWILKRLLAQLAKRIKA